MESMKTAMDTSTRLGMLRLRVAALAPSLGCHTCNLNLSQKHDSCIVKLHSSGSLA
jgi:hypothetical protein